MVSELHTFRPAPATPRGYATVRFEAQAWELDLGFSLTFGRSYNSDIVISARAADLLVSRRAGRLTAVEGGVLVSNESRQNSVYLQGIPGPQLEIQPLMTLGTMPFTRCRIVVPGRDAARYVLDITCWAAEGASSRPSGGIPVVRPGFPATFDNWRLELPDAQRRYLAALCEPILTGAGPQNGPATYRQIAERCHVSPGTVRHSLDALRQRLSAEYGTPGPGPVGDAPGHLAALADWAVRSGTVNQDDLEALGP